MLEILVSKPCAFAGVDFDPAEKEKIEKAANAGHTVVSISYLHGKVQKEMGYDKGVILNGEECLSGDKWKKGIYYVHVEGYNNPCKAFLWNNDSTPRGLIVDIADEDSLAYAKSCYINEEKVL